MDNATELGKALKEWRTSNGYTTFQIAKEEGGKLRYEYLNKFENDGGGSARTLCAYLHFAITHGFKMNKSHLFETRKNEVYKPRENDVTPTRKNDVEELSSSLSKSSEGQGENVTQNKDVTEQCQHTSKTSNTILKEVEKENEKEEHKVVSEASDATSEQQLTTPPDSEVKEPNSGEFTSVTDDKNIASQTVVPEPAKDTKVSPVEDTGGYVKTPEVTPKITVYDDLDTMSPEQEKQYDKYMNTLHMQECYEPLDEKCQRLLITVGHTCPKCGGRLRIKRNTKEKDENGKDREFIGCVNYRKGGLGCNYTANGSFDNPVIEKRFLPTLTPNPELNPCS